MEKITLKNKDGNEKEFTIYTDIGSTRQRKRIEKAHEFTFSLIEGYAAELGNRINDESLAIGIALNKQYWDFMIKPDIVINEYLNVITKSKENWIKDYEDSIYELIQVFFTLTDQNSKNVEVETVTPQETAPTENEA